MPQVRSACVDELEGVYTLGQVGREVVSRGGGRRNCFFSFFLVIFWGEGRKREGEDKSVRGGKKNEKKKRNGAMELDEL